ncbi:hypothetical protein GTZ99_01000 [Novosphingobium sp. FSY-8]|uniref:TonB C-terminal domain-containing protein n=1 Tax=Novosphingobium ovatum TaxID=1908523 RepID=A0ABW9X9C0_9SPHN|nr:energy transducer TonB [Novosphingobium ovatum]NBC35131.1 hypothetical protein [Novosphingobium ovatum]
MTKPHNRITLCRQQGMEEELRITQPRKSGVWIAGMAWLGLTLGAPATAHAQTAPLELAPSSRWNLNYSDDSCRLMREFGQGEDKVILIMDSYAPDMDGYITLVGKQFVGSDPYKKVSYGFEPGEPKSGATAIRGVIGAQATPLLILGMALPKIQAIWQNQDILFRLTPTSGRAMTLKVGPMAEVAKALNTCTAALVTQWGFTPEQQAAWKRLPEPIGEPQKWMRDGWDYPLTAEMRNLNGVVHYRLMVDAAGTPTRCILQSETQPAEFGNEVCTVLMRRARFKPAQDRAGAPVASYFTGTVRFFDDPDH